MITYTNTRYKTGETFPSLSQQGTPLRALRTIAFCDFGFGGHVTDVTETDDTVTLTTQTSCLGATDVVTYTGTPEDMHLILRLAGYVTAMQADEDGQEAIIANALKQLQANDRLRRPLYLTAAGGMLVGEGVTRLSLVAVLVEECYGSDDTSAFEIVVGYSRSIKFDDLISAYDLAKTENVDFIEVLALAAEKAA